MKVEFKPCCHRPDPSLDLLKQRIAEGKSKSTTPKISNISDPETKTDELRLYEYITSKQQPGFEKEAIELEGKLREQAPDLLQGLKDVPSVSESRVATNKFLSMLKKIIEQQTKLTNDPVKMNFPSKGKTSAAIQNLKDQKKTTPYDSRYLKSRECYDVRDKV